MPTGLIAMIHSSMDCGDPFLHSPAKCLLCSEKAGGRPDRRRVAAMAAELRHRHFVSPYQSEAAAYRGGPLRLGFAGPAKSQRAWVVGVSVDGAAPLFFICGVADAGRSPDRVTHV